MFEVVKTQDGWAVREVQSGRVVEVFARALDALAFVAAR